METIFFCVMYTGRKHKATQTPSKHRLMLHEMNKMGTDLSYFLVQTHFIEDCSFSTHILYFPKYKHKYMKTSCLQLWYSVQGINIIRSRDRAYSLQRSLCCSRFRQGKFNALVYELRIGVRTDTKVLPSDSRSPKQRCT